ncbi:MAG: hypothetical protein ACP5UQ_04315 [Anaerolineae bacterium]
MRPFKTLICILLATIIALSLGGCRKEDTRQLKQESLPQVSTSSSPLPTPNVQVSPLQK